MSRSKQSSKGRGRRRVVTALGVAGALSLAGGASASISPARDIPTQNLSITHNSCADRGAQPDIGETGQAAPHHDVPRRRIIGAREVSA